MSDRNLPPVLIQPIKRIKRARAMRKELSLPEVLLWRELKGQPLGMKFRRQFPVLTFYADFACLSARLLIEIDGIAHTMGNRPERDERRDMELTAAGRRVIRIPATAVLKDVQAAAEVIVKHALSSMHQPRD